MATILLQTAGSIVGAALGGPIGAVVGRSLGAIAGSQVDQRLFGPGDQHVTGPRLDSAQILSSREGIAIPKAYGRCRVSGEIIWSTRFEEVQNVETRSQGGKGGPPKTTVTSYAYFANFAVGLCQGEIGGIGRIWVDGKLLEQPEYTLRLHNGNDHQLPDSLIEAKQGAGNAPAYRGTAYLVFEKFPLEKFGNRIPQIAVEVLRPIGLLEKHVHAVNMIPGATEFGYDTQPAIRENGQGESNKVNVNQFNSETDFLASLDELVALCPNLKQIALVITWFGTDLRADHCEIRPGVETNEEFFVESNRWIVAGAGRSQALLVSRSDNAPAFGGTPSDPSVIRAISAIKSRGLKVCLNPFVMMDIPVENGLSDPYGEDQQSVYPWRGRITCDPAPGQPNNPDGTQLARSQIDTFAGSVSASQFTRTSDTVVHVDQSEWTYRRMVLHYAHLAEVAGGVDMFLIGSEMRGLTSVRAENNTFPFVEHLGALADDVTSILGDSCLVTYGADWSEYFGFQPQDGSQNVFFNLDSLWSRPSIGAVGIDNYMPLSDWRPDSDLPDIGRTSSDGSALVSNLDGGEGYDWYYESPSNRDLGIRTPISDGLGKPWVFRYKDLANWWSNNHFNRVGGIEEPEPTAWVPQSKPFIFTEFGCPAVHNGNAQPNVFYDPKSAESFFPYFSNGGRDDFAQASYIAAHQQHWDEGHPDFYSPNNPASPSYSGRMVDFDKSQLWAWDARPYPTFPSRSDLWRDADNWHVGHWLNGRLGSVRLADLIAELLTENGITEFEVKQVHGVVDGYIIAETSSARGALEFLLTLFQISVHEDAGTLYFRSNGNDQAAIVDSYDHVQLSGEPLSTFLRDQKADLPISAHLRHLDPNNDFQDTETFISKIDQTQHRQHWFSGPLVFGAERVKPVLGSWLKQRWAGREKVTFSVPWRRSELTVGDIIEFEQTAYGRRFRIEQIEDGVELKITAQVIESTELTSPQLAEKPRLLPQSPNFAQPKVRFLDLPIIPGSRGTDGNRIAVTATPWSGPQAVYVSPSTDGFEFVQLVENSSFIGTTVTELLSSKATSRWDRSQMLTIRLDHGALSSASRLATLNGANILFVKSYNTAWEVLQFKNAELIAEDTWQISVLLRGQLGTEIEASLGAPVGTEVVVYNQAVEQLQIADQIRGLEVNWQIGPSGKELGGIESIQDTYSPGYRALLPFKPAHLRAKVGPTGDLTLNWVRRSRLNSDDWQLAEIPLAEDTENYSVMLSDNSDNSLLKSVDSSHLFVPKEELEIEFGVQLASLNVKVSQISSVVGAGPEAEIQVPIN